MNTELMEALTILEKEKNISKDVMMDAIENSLISACKNHFGTAENIKVIMDRETCDYAVYAEKKVVEEVTNPALEISLEDAEKIDSTLHIGDVAQADGAVFENTYTADGSWTPEGIKTLTGRKMTEEDVFTFSVKENGIEVLTGTATGTADAEQADIVFDGSIPYDLEDMEVKSVLGPYQYRGIEGLDLYAGSPETVFRIVRQ